MAETTGAISELGVEAAQQCGKPRPPDARLDLRHRRRDHVGSTGDRDTAEVGDQGGLADPRLAANQRYRSTASDRASERSLECVPFRSSPGKLHAVSMLGGARRACVIRGSRTTTVGGESFDQRRIVFAERRDSRRGGWRVAEVERWPEHGGVAGLGVDVDEAMAGLELFVLPDLDRLTHPAEGDPGGGQPIDHLLGVERTEYVADLGLQRVDVARRGRGW